VRPGACSLIPFSSDDQLSVNQPAVVIEVTDHPDGDLTTASRPALRSRRRPGITLHELDAIAHRIRYERKPDVSTFRRGRRTNRDQQRHACGLASRDHVVERCDAQSQIILGGRVAMGSGLSSRIGKLGQLEQAVAEPKRFNVRRGQVDMPGGAEAETGTIKLPHRLRVVDAQSNLDRRPCVRSLKKRMFCHYEILTAAETHSTRQAYQSRPGSCGVFTIDGVAPIRYRCSAPPSMLGSAVRGWVRDRVISRRGLFDEKVNRPTSTSPDPTGLVCKLTRHRNDDAQSRWCHRIPRGLRSSGCTTNTQTIQDLHVARGDGIGGAVGLCP
jgi:hypothetical protein